MRKFFTCMVMDFDYIFLYLSKCSSTLNLKVNIPDISNAFELLTSLASQTLDIVLVRGEKFSQLVYCNVQNLADIRCILTWLPEAETHSQTISLSFRKWRDIQHLRFRLVMSRSIDNEQFKQWGGSIWFGTHLFVFSCYLLHCYPVSSYCWQPLGLLRHTHQQRTPRQSHKPLAVVPGHLGPSHSNPCRAIWRWSSFSAWTVETLKSFVHNLAYSVPHHCS